MEDVTFLGVEMGSLGFRAQQCCNCLKIRFKKLLKYKSLFYFTFKLFYNGGKKIAAFKNCAR